MLSEAGSVSDTSLPKHQATVLNSKATSSGVRSSSKRTNVSKQSSRATLRGGGDDSGTASVLLFGPGIPTTVVAGSNSVGSGSVAGDLASVPSVDVGEDVRGSLSNSNNINNNKQSAGEKKPGGGGSSSSKSGGTGDLRVFMCFFLVAFSWFPIPNYFVPALFTMSMLCWGPHGWAPVQPFGRGGLNDWASVLGSGEAGAGIPGLGACVCSLLTLWWHVVVLWWVVCGGVWCCWC